MDSDILATLFDRTRAFWIGTALVLIGVFLPPSVQVGGRWLGPVFLGTGGALLLVRGLAVLGERAREQ
jgi:hypothetical protein